jgi:hypothetical protein
MVRSLIAILILALLIGAAFLMRRGPATVPSAEANKVLEEWLNASCTVGESNRLQDALRRFGPELETPLINLFEQGPPASEIARVDAKARRDFERIDVLIKSGNAAKLPDKDIQLLRTTQADRYVMLAREEYIGGQRSAALAGLGVIGGNRGRRLLERIAADSSSPYQDVARLARYGRSISASR